MKNIIIPAVMAVAATAAMPAHSVITQNVHLKNGTVLSGYVQQQDGNDNIIFCSERAVVSIDGRFADVSEKGYRYSDLDDKWKEWAEKNNAYTGTDDGKILMLNEIRFLYNPEDTAEWIPEVYDFEHDLRDKQRYVSKVKVLEKGATLKYLELTPITYRLNWKDVEAIKADRRPSTMLSGIDRTYRIKGSREVSGQYAGETYNTLSLYDKNGMVETFNMDDVDKYNYKGINPDQTIFEQSELLDVVNTKDRSYRGVIIERNFTAGNNYLVIMQSAPDNETRVLKFADIIGYSKEENKEYSPIVDVILEKGELRLNGHRLDSVGVNKREHGIALDSVVNRKVVVPAVEGNTKVTVEYNNELRMPSDHLMLVKLMKYGEKKKAYYAFSTDIFEMKKFEPVKTTTSVNNTTRLEYVLTERGLYALYDSRLRKAMPFIVK